MSAVQRVNLLAGALFAFSLILIIFQSTTQEVETQSEGGPAAEEPTYPREGVRPGARSSSSSKNGSTQSDLAALNWRNDATTEENLPRSDVNVVDLPDDRVYTSDAVEVLNYAVANGAKISNNSWDGGGYGQALKGAIVRADAAGHLFVAAAGNDGKNNDATPQYPASYNNPNIISVAATDDNDALASFSNYGASSVDVAAPGVNILSTRPHNSYGIYSGTSMATPRVTGVAALIKSQHPAIDDAQLKAQILQYVEGKSGLQGKVVTGGRLNAYASLAQGAPPDDIRPPVASVRPQPSTRDCTPTLTVTDAERRSHRALAGQHRLLLGWPTEEHLLLLGDHRSFHLQQRPALDRQACGQDHRHGRRG